MMPTNNTKNDRRQRRWGRSSQFSQPSVDAAALIEVLKAEGLAFRSEEKREDRGKTAREWITITVISLTLVAVCWQVKEMIKVYDPIKDQADATKTLATGTADQAKALADQSAASVAQAQAAKLQGEVAVTAAQISQKAFIASQRAWVGPTNAFAEAEPKAGELWKLVVTYQNSGRDPAKAFTYTTSWITNTAEQNIHASSSALDFTSHYKDECMRRSASPGGQVVYPGSSFGTPYQIHFTVPKATVDEDVVKGDKILYLHGCFVYKTLDTTHHSYFCYSYKKDITKITALNICEIGQDAD